MKDYSNKTTEEILHELAISQSRTSDEVGGVKKETEAISKETEVIKKETEVIKKEAEVIKKETEVIKKETEELRKKGEKLRIEVEEMHKENEKIFKKNERIRKKNQKEANIYYKMLIGMGVTQGMISEDIMWENFESVFRKRGKVFYNAIRNLTRKNRSGRKMAEYDIVATNTNEIMVVEIKTRLTENHVRRFIDVQLPKFRKLFPEYVIYKKLLACVGGRTITEEAKSLADKEGIYLLKQCHDRLNHVQIVSDDSFREHVFDI